VRSNNSIRLFSGVVLLLVIVGGSFCSSLGTVVADSSTFGSYFQSPNTTATSATNPIAKPTANNSLNLPFQSENSFVSTYVPLTGVLSKGNYINLMGLKTSKVVKGDLSMQVPCDYKGNPRVAVIAGVLPNFKTVNMGNAITNANLNGRPILHLSVNSVSCLYNAVIPADITNIALVNISGKDLNLNPVNGEYAVIITAQLR